MRSSGRSSPSASAARRPLFFFDARDRFDGASGFSGSSPFFVSLAWRSAMAAVRPRLHVASRYKSMSGTVCGTHSMRPLDRLSGSTA